MADKLLTAFHVWRHNLRLNLWDYNGDSRAKQHHVSAVLPRPIGKAALGPLNWGNALSGQRMTLGGSFATSGSRSDQYILEYKAARLASHAGVSFWNSGIVNNIAQATAGYIDLISGLAVTVANVALVSLQGLITEWELDLAAGKRVIVCTEPGATNLNPAQVAAVHEYNMRLKCWADTRPGVILLDVTPVLWSPAGSGTAIAFKAGYLQPGDPTHLSPLGAYMLGKLIFAPLMRQMLPERDRAVVAAHDAYNVNPRQLAANPLHTTLSGGNTQTNVTVSSGTVPGSRNVRADVPMSVAITSEDVVAGDAASGKNVILSLTNGAAAGIFTYEVFSPATAYWAVDSLIETGAEVDVAANSGGAHVFLGCDINTNNGTKQAWDMYATRGQGAGPSEAYSLSLKSEVEQPLAGAAATGYIAFAVRVALDANATCVVKVRRMWGYLRYPAPAW
ncbi:hypothetical protein [Rhizobium sp. Leaf383]|uniref:hypothetical protein n=1 Tax=Rhizobium sp. Leaf383 TaxID=1736357 RepID=UPI00071247DC|nr:hypothetical protein [Rhizobium sp. Leaf383]KQS74515.1 hypothetical protein ASG58_16255 [Rhizobium sp. Leaf383]